MRTLVKAKDDNILNIIGLCFIFSVSSVSGNSVTNKKIDKNSELKYF